MTKVLIKVINFYRNWLSPLKLRTCRFYPSCSEYAVHSLERHGFFGGIVRAVKRVLRCHPFSAGGYDPVD